MYSVALIPAAGRGARLDRPNTPKPLVDVGGRPVIVHLLERLAEVGVKRAVVVVGFEGKKIVRELTNHPELDLQIDFVEHADWETGLAGSLLAAREAVSAALLDQTLAAETPGGVPANLSDLPGASDLPAPPSQSFILAMADHLFERPLFEKIASAHLEDAQVCAMLVDRDIEQLHDLNEAVKVTLEGNAVTDAGRNLSEFQGVDAGLFLCRPELFDALAAVHPGPDASTADSGASNGARHRVEPVELRLEPVDLTAALAKLGAAGRLGALFVDGELWFDIDTPSILIRAEMAIRRQRRIERVFQPSFEPAATPDAQTDGAREYIFTTGKAQHTQVLVQRGFVRNPATLKLIPDESASSPVYVLTDTRVNALYGDDFVGGLRAMGYDVRRVVMAEGEESKTLANYTRLVEHIIGQGIDERTVLVSLGGGAVCNVCGFLASTLYRGVGLVHVPTTLMAQCDAAISHKQGVNGKHGKNLVGAYYPPIRIAVDVEVLQTLEDWLIPDGLSEVIKHALGQDPGYLDYLRNYAGDMRDLDFLEHVVRKNIELKCQLMAVDPKEFREGMVLQYGHTVGHPIEFLSGYALNHGQSVGIGMMVAARVSRLLGGCDDQMVALHHEVISKFQLPTRIPETIEVDDILAMMRYNKRYLTEGTRMALVDGPGHLWSVDGDYVIPVSDSVLREAIEQTY